MRCGICFEPAGYVRCSLLFSPIILFSTRGKSGLGSLSVVPSNPLIYILLLISTTLSFVDLELLVSYGGLLSQVVTKWFN